MLLKLIISKVKYLALSKLGLFASPSALSILLPTNVAGGFEVSHVTLGSSSLGIVMLLLRFLVPSSHRYMLLIINTFIFITLIIILNVIMGLFGCGVHETVMYLSKEHLENILPESIRVISPALVVILIILVTAPIIKLKRIPFSWL
jgi:hypothetical protein